MKEKTVLSIGADRLTILHTPGHTPGSVVVYVDRKGKRILFGQVIHGPFDPAFKSDISAWRQSMLKLLDLEADLLAEGHYGLFEGKQRVYDFISDFLIDIQTDELVTLDGRHRL